MSPACGAINKRPKKVAHVLENNSQLSKKVPVAPAMPAPFGIVTPRRLGGIIIPTRKKTPKHIKKTPRTIETIILPLVFS